MSKLDERERAFRELLVVNNAKTDRYKKRCMELESQITKQKVESPRFGDMDYYRKMLSLDQDS